MPRLRSTLPALIAAAALLLTPGAAHAAAPSTATATFRPGSGFYLSPAGGTDAGRATVSGQVTFTQAASRAPITAVGHLDGLAANTPYVVVPYKDAECLPLAGVSAFPSGSFTTDSTGAAHFSVTVNPTAIVPTGVFDVAQTKSVSVRQVVIVGTGIGGLIGVPTVPNVAMPEACDRKPVTS